MNKHLLFFLILFLVNALYWTTNLRPIFKVSISFQIFFTASTLFWVDRSKGLDFFSVTQQLSIRLQSVTGGNFFFLKKKLNSKKIFLAVLLNLIKRFFLETCQLELLKEFLFNFMLKIDDYKINHQP